MNIDTSTTAGKIAVMQEAESGAMVQALRRGGEEWSDPFEERFASWDWDSYNYRIAPEPPKKKVVPWDAETCPVGQLVRPQGCPRHKYMIVGATPMHAEVGAGGDSDISYNILFQSWEQLDGSPCGTEVTE